MRTPESADWGKEAAIAHRATMALEPVCGQCETGGYGPSHQGSVACESGSIASGGTKSHCTCDVCF